MAFSNRFSFSEGTNTGDSHSSSSNLNYSYSHPFSVQQRPTRVASTSADEEDYLTELAEDVDDAWLNELLQCTGYFAPQSASDREYLQTPVVQSEWDAIEEASTTRASVASPDALDETSISESTPASSNSETHPASHQSSVDPEACDEVGPGPSATEPLDVQPLSPSTSQSAVLRDSTNQLTFTLQPSESSSNPTPVAKSSLRPKRKQVVAPLSNDFDEFEEGSSSSQRPTKRRKVQRKIGAAGQQGQGQSGTTTVAIPTAHDDAPVPVTQTRRLIRTSSEAMDTEAFNQLVADPNDSRRRYPQPLNPALTCPISHKVNGRRVRCGTELLRIDSAENHLVKVHRVPRNKHVSSAKISCPWEGCRQRMSGSVMRHVLAVHLQELHMICVKCRKPIHSRSEEAKKHMDKCWP
ncbi:hypothetical protein CVT24_000817 [Panaeolus cyanescens]|uniref:Uncharacterized protein n=1 Tax=Panaeolus cyanescens TaxID=181874 RepID=A0A409YCW0_9AGAR|nr:hypothetical protein CVT24_000817 [Panaeolus cyanescens]